MTRELPGGEVEFLFYRPGVSQMYLAGDFNGWNSRDLPMTPFHEGWWKCRLRLDPGSYRFRYYTGEQWFTDYAAFGVEPGPFGWNSVVHVAALQRSAA